MPGRMWTRRDVLKAGGAALAAPFIFPANPLRASPGEQMKVAVIGLGGRASGVIGADCHPLIAGGAMRVVAVADCFPPRVDAFLGGPSKNGWKGYTDFRKMIEVEKPDGVMIETTTHARGWIAVTAMQMGVDCYIEKPMALTIAEGRYMVKAARRYNRVTQVGTQQRSIDLNNRASDLVKSGKLGKCLTVLAPNFVGPKIWKDQPGQPMPNGLDDRWWDIWTSQAMMRPYHPSIHYGWAMWSDYDGGGECFGVTGWGTHSYDQVNRGLGTDDTGPTEVTMEEPVQPNSRTGKFAKPARQEDTGLEYHGMAKEVVGPRSRITMKFASGTELKLHLDGDAGPGLGAIFVCEKGKVEINRNKILCDPPEIAAGMRPAEGSEGRGTTFHVENWIECVKTRRKANADIEIGQRATTLCYLVNIIRAIGKVGTIHWDPAAERFADCEEANKLLDRERRKGWELPALT